MQMTQITLCATAGAWEKWSLIKTSLNIATTSLTMEQRNAVLCMLINRTATAGGGNSKQLIRTHIFTNRQVKYLLG